MSPLIGKKKSVGKTALILDIENGSVGSALTHFSPQAQPKLFGEKRVSLAHLAAPHGAALEQEVHRATKDAFHNAALVAARLRGHEQTAALGQVDRAIVFLHAPWAALNFSEGPQVSAEASPEFLDSIRGVAQEFLGDAPLSFHAFAASASPIMHSIFLTPERSLVCLITGEVTELALTSGTGIEGYATFPMGSHTIVRTLQSHGGFSEEEISSLLRLPLYSKVAHPKAIEPLLVLERQFAQQFKEVAEVLLENGVVQNVFVLAPEPLGEWFARALTHDFLADVFSEGGSVQALRQKHLSPHIQVHGSRPDLSLLLGALFADSRFGSV